MIEVLSLRAERPSRIHTKLAMATAAKPTSAVMLSPAVAALAVGGQLPL